jgi:hypothetical protein
MRVPNRPNRVDNSPAQFWADLQALVTLLDPVVDAIHQLEADRPLLSQLLSVWRHLLAHSEAFERQHPTRATNVAAMFQRRHLIHADDAHYASFLLDPINFSKNGVNAWMPPFDQMDQAEVDRVHACLKALAAPDGDAAVEQLNSLEAVGVNAAMARTLPKLTERVEDESGKVQLAPVAARVNFWASSTAVAAYPKLAAAAQRLLTMHATSCASERNWSMWGRVYTKLRASLAIERAEKLVFIMQNYMDPNALPTTGEDWEVFLKTLEEDAQEEGASAV